MFEGDVVLGQKFCQSVELVFRYTTSKASSIINENVRPGSDWNMKLMATCSLVLKTPCTQVPRCPGTTRLELRVGAVILKEIVSSCWISRHVSNR